MKRALALLLTVTIAAVLAPVGAQAARAPQEEEGNIMLPAPGPQQTEGCWQGIPRRFYMFSNGATSGPMGSMIEIDKATWGGKFKLEVTGGGTGAEDLDVQFFYNIGTIDPVNDPAQQNAELGPAYATRKAGGEVGIVPPSTTTALFCIAIGTGYDASWKYTATPPKKKKK